MKRLVKDNLVSELDLKSVPTKYTCEPCLKGKLGKKSFPKESSSRASEVLELVHSDVSGRFDTESIGGKKYFVTFIDDKSRRVWIYTLKRKDEVLEKFREWKAMVETETGKKVKSFRSDNGGEYTSGEFDRFLKINGIKRQWSIPGTPEQNGTAERMNRTLVEAVRAMLADNGLPRKFWAEMITTVVYLRNRWSTKSLDKVTPMEGGQR